jgi:hypothetical protein
MTVRDFIKSMTEEDMDKELIISSDEEGNCYHTIDPEITTARIENSVFQEEGEPNALILTPDQQIEQEW